MGVLRDILLFICAAGVTAVSAILIHEYRAPLDSLALQDRTSAVVDDAVEPPPIPEFDPPELERFASAFDRPLFRESRRPQAAPVAITETPVEASLDVVLKGVTVTGAESFALVAPIGALNSVRIALGETYEGWTLVEIGTDSVLFRRDGEEVRLELIYGSSRGGPGN